MLRLFLIPCAASKKMMIRSILKIWLQKEREEMKTEIFNGGVDGVAALEEETEQPWTNITATSGNANYFSIISSHNILSFTI